MSDKRLSPEAQDKLVQQLRSNLSRRRVRPMRWTLGGMVLVAILAGLWYANRPNPPSLPPLMLTCFDALEGQWAEAQLVAAGAPDANLEGLEIHWKVTRQNKIEEKATTKTDRAGHARYRIGSTPQNGAAADDHGERELHVAFVDPAGAYRHDCYASLFPLAEGAIVDVADLMPEGDSVAWSRTTLAALPAPASASTKSEKTLYAAGLVDGDTYRAMRNWLHHHQAQPRTALPRGPLLHEGADHLEKRLRDSGANVVRWRPQGRP
jgi:hypothetical protein